MGLFEVVRADTAYPRFRDMDGRGTYDGPSTVHPERRGIVCASAGVLGGCWYRVLVVVGGCIHATCH